MATRKIRGFVIAGFIVTGLALAPVTHADNQPSPGAPIIRTASRGTALAGSSEVRVAKNGAVQGGAVSVGAPTLTRDGNPAPPACNPTKIKDPILQPCS